MEKMKPLSFVVFGATGDLSQRKIMPALFSLYSQHKIPENSTFIAFSRRTWTDEEFRSFIKPSLVDKNNSEQAMNSFLERVVYIEGTFDTQESYERLKRKIVEVDALLDQPAQKIYHLAVQPEFYERIVQGLGKAELNKSISGESYVPRLIIEKPFGHDINSAQLLEKIISQFFSEDQTYRIDHYLGKAGVEEIFDTRKNDPALELKLNNNNVSSIKVQLHESIDIEGRGEFYDTIGAMRDVGQNHALEMIAIIAMDIPHDLHAMVRRREEILKNLKRIDGSKISTQVVRGQYEGYTQEQDVHPQSKTETYFFIEFEIDTERWAGVRFEIEGGKALGKKKSEIILTFKDGSEQIFNLEGSPLKQEVRDAYEILVGKSIEGDKTFFVSIDEVLASWRFITPIIEQSKNFPLKIYKKGIYPLQ
ncbi:glucose-6-phosphate dehydrogenase (NADP(+)) [Patescibacteria group bacterium]|nr:glucose-6-phosphate dehydrogenase (NADP(+)) [Patescibacteria group bacterium]